VEGKKTPIAPAKVSSIIISNAATMTTDAIQLALEHNIDVVFIEYQVKLQIVSLSLQIAGFSETPVSPFLQIDFNLFANSVSTFLQIWYHRFCKSSFNLFANEDLWT